MFHVKQRMRRTLLPDAELREDLAEHVLNVEPACETPERVTGLAQMLCGDFRVVAGIGAGKKLIESASRALDFLPVPGARDERSFTAAEAFYRKPDKRCFESIKSVAGFRGDEERSFGQA